MPSDTPSYYPRARASLQFGGKLVLHSRRGVQIIKQIILIRRDLKMRRGKEIAQGSHSSMAFLISRLRQHPETIGEASLALKPQEIEWITKGMAKVCLKVNSEEELLECHAKARESGIESHLIRDSGRTEFGGVPTLTACAIGPDEPERIDRITGELTLY
jgi:PTH2 family peptidyl-tRNA hydrolase